MTIRFPFRRSFSHHQNYKLVADPETRTRLQLQFFPPLPTQQRNRADNPQTHDLHHHANNVRRTNYSRGSCPLVPFWFRRSLPCQCLRLGSPPFGGHLGKFDRSTLPSSSSLELPGPWNATAAAQ